MPYAKPQSNYRPRELRRRVIMPARLHSSSGWTDACILNVSSRGLMIHSARAGPQGSIVELRRGRHAIVARVVWRDGARVGLKTEERLAVEDLIRLNCASATMVTAGQAQKRARGTPSQRRERNRRSLGRVIEYVGVALIACTLAATAFDVFERGLGTPMALIETALAG